MLTTWSYMPTFIDPTDTYFWMTTFMGLLYLPTLLYSCFIGCTSIFRTCFYDKLDPAPPWNLDHVAILYYPRHFRKHGRYKFRPRHPVIRKDHLWMLLQLLLLGPPKFTPSAPVAMKLRHLQWESDAPATWTLPYFDVDVDSFGSTDPSSIMNIFKRHQRPPPKPPEQDRFFPPPPTLPDIDDEFDSPSAHSFRLESFCLDDVFASDYDPSDIMQIYRFNNILTHSDFPVFFTMLEQHSAFNAQGLHSTPKLIVDSGASKCITPLRSDFIKYYPSTAVIHGLSANCNVSGEGIINWQVIDNNGNQVSIQLPGYHIPSAEVRLLSPQEYFRRFGGHSVMTAFKITLHLITKHVLEAPFCPQTNLPCLTTIEQANKSQSSFWTSTFDFTTADALAYPTLLSSENNTNISAAQKELILYHQRLSHASIRKIHHLMRTRKWLCDRIKQDPTFRCGTFLPCQTLTPTCDTTGFKCLACVCAKAQKRSSTSTARHDPDRLHSVPSQPLERSEMTLKRGHIKPGDCLSADHYLSPISGRLYTSFGRERQGYTCGTLFVDHASGKIFNFPQFSTNAMDTIDSKRKLERCANEEGILVKAYHSDNGVFASDAFKNECQQHGQKLTFSGVGAHHQNGVAERNIKTISQWARANMLHAAYHWHEHANVKLWPQAVDYAAWVFNRLPSAKTGLSPNDLWSSAFSTGYDLRRARPFGCPVYVLDPKLQDGGKIPKWDTRARRGMFVGFSPHHSSLVPLVMNINTGKITPQFHVVFDEKFQTVASLPKGETLRDEWTNILTFERDCFLDDDDNTPDDDENTSDTPPHSRLLPKEFVDWFTNRTTADEPPSHDTVIIDEPDSVEIVHDAHDYDYNDYDAPPVDVELDHQAGDSEGAAQTDTPLPPATASEGGFLGPAPEGETSGRPKRNVGTWKDGPAIHRRLPIDGEEYDYSFNSCFIDQPVALIAQRGLTSLQPPPQKITKRTLLDCIFLQHEWTYQPNHHSYLLVDLDDKLHVDNVTDPRVLEVHLASTKYNDDNPSFDMAMNGPFQAEYWEAMQSELHTISTEFKCWTLVPRLPHMHVLPSTWAFKVKRYPDGSVKKFKARFCARGDRQLEGIDYFETWAPVVQWSTIRVVMIIAAKLNYCSAQCDITAAFIHAFLPSDEHVYVEQPRGFAKKQNHVLRLNRSLYGLKQAPRHFFTYLSERLIKHGLNQSQYDPCLFMTSTMMVIVYVDDILIYAKDDKLIDSFIHSMQKDDICLRREGTAEGYLGIDIRSVNGQLHLTQSGLSQRILNALGLSKHSNSCPTPADTAPLPRDTDGDPASGTINYASVVGMLLYLSGHSRPDLSFAVHQCARYTFAPTKRHEKALLRIGHYLKGTVDKGLILQPSDALHLDCYPDADFAGMWKHEDSNDPHCVRSRTGYVITLANCPIIWASKMQTEIALSTMEAEYIALSTACRDLFPLMDKLVEITTILDLPFAAGSNMHIRIHEDNAGALVLGKLEPRRMTPRSKHYAVKYHWFREHLSPRNIDLVKIASENQLGDIFTKGLGGTAFKRMRQQLMGW